MSQEDSEPSTKPKLLQKQRSSRPKKRSVWARQPRIVYGERRDRVKNREFSHERKQKKVVEEVLRERDDLRHEHRQKRAIQQVLRERQEMANEVADDGNEVSA